MKSERVKRNGPWAKPIGTPWESWKAIREMAIEYGRLKWIDDSIQCSSV